MANRSPCPRTSPWSPVLLLMDHNSWLYSLSKAKLAKPSCSSGIQAEVDLSRRMQSWLDDMENDDPHTYSGHGSSQLPQIGSSFVPSNPSRSTANHTSESECFESHLHGNILPMNPYPPVTEYSHSECPDGSFDYQCSQHVQVPIPSLGSFPNECPLAPHQIAHIQQLILSSGVNSLPSPPPLQLEPGSLSGHGSTSSRETSPSSVQPNQSQDHDDSEAEHVVTVEKRRRNTAASGKRLLNMLD